MAKKAFELERELAAVRAEYHEAVSGGEITENDRREREAGIAKLNAELAVLYCKGAIQRPDGVKPFGMKVRPGVYEVGNRLPSGPDNLRSRGETPDEAIQNWNDGVFYESAGPGVVVETAASSPGKSEPDKES